MPKTYASEFRKMIALARLMKEKGVTLSRQMKIRSPERPELPTVANSAPDDLGEDQLPASRGFGSSARN